MKPEDSVRIRELVIGDYEPVYALWSITEGVGLNESDSPGAIDAFLRRNPGLSRIAVDAEGRVLGALLCGHDGRRGYLHHLAVAREQRRRGIGKALVESSLSALQALGIPKCNLFLYADNEEGRRFWIRNRWAARTDLVLIQRSLK
jgi:putative acetyltransferase